MNRLHLGTIGWSYPFWRGMFYPPKTPSKGFLAYYATQYGTVEVDSTFYRIPSEQTIQGWNMQTPEHFLFSFKFPQIITHVKRLRDCQTETDVFLDRVSHLGQKLGALLLQFPPNFSDAHFGELEHYLQRLPKRHRYVVEVRHESWLNQEFTTLLNRHNIALAWVDSPRKLEISEKTADFLYIRWEGDRAAVNGTLGKIEADRGGDLSVWAQKLKPHVDADTSVFGYCGKYFSGYPPADVNQLHDLLGTDIKRQAPLELG